MGSASAVRTETKRGRKSCELLSVKSLGEINHVSDISDADVTSVSVVSEHDSDIINVPKFLSRSHVV